jgi:hypothetical protein
LSALPLDEGQWQALYGLAEVFRCPITALGEQLLAEMEVNAEMSVAEVRWRLRNGLNALRIQAQQ